VTDDNELAGREHVARASAQADGTFVIDGLGDTEFKQEWQEYGQFECSCGESFETRDEAEKHVIESNRQRSLHTDGNYD